MFSCGRIVVMPNLREPPVQQQNLTIRPDQDIVGFNVAVQHADSVGIAQRVANLQDDIHELRKVVSLSVVKQLSQCITVD